MFCVYDIFCFSFLREEDKKLYNSMLNTIYSHHKLSDGALELRKKRLNCQESYCRRKENSLIHEHLFPGVAGNEKIRKNLSTGRTCNL